MSKPAGAAGGFSRFRIDLSYDGTDFAGWAKQPTLRTVQGDLLKAMIKIFGEDEHDFGMRVAGRTDAGQTVEQASRGHAGNRSGGREHGGIDALGRRRHQRVAHQALGIGGE